jgi:hypothetical protein
MPAARNPETREVLRKCFKVLVEREGLGRGSTGKSSRDEGRMVFSELVPIEACLKKSRAGFSLP